MERYYCQTNWGHFYVWANDTIEAEIIATHDLSDNERLLCVEEAPMSEMLTTF